MNRGRGQGKEERKERMKEGKEGEEGREERKKEGMQVRQKGGGNKVRRQAGRK